MSSKKLALTQAKPGTTKLAEEVSPPDASVLSDPGA